MGIVLKYKLMYMGYCVCLVCKEGFFYVYFESEIFSEIVDEIVEKICEKL